MRRIFISFMKAINLLIPKNRNYIYYIPHNNCLIDKYDLINYRSDNVLSLFNYMIRQKEYTDVKYIIELPDIKQIDTYNKYCNKTQPNISVVFLQRIERPLLRRINSLKLLVRNFFYFFRSSYIFVDTYYYDFSYKLSSQKIICLSYYSPFKDDYHIDSDYYQKIRNRTNASFDFHLSTSKIASQIISVDSGISFHKFLNLGFPRNDNLFEQSRHLYIKQEISKQVNCEFEKVILYAPTFRDYEKGKANEVRNLFGYEGADIELLSKILEENNCVILAKLHPFQNVDIINSRKYKNIHVMSPCNTLSLSDLMIVSTALITDYTSTYFDYLLLDKPTIFNFYDIEIYRRHRGFAYDPIEIFCAGEKVYTYEMLIGSVLDVLNRIDQYSKERKIATHLFNKYIDNNSSKRICEFLFSNKDLRQSIF